ncbi:DNA-lyase [Trichodelitschia bisporula]|uniref:Apurinic-apyrimidinic endonuclease 1 n=1 Tax=Trichodelitschia bisporula TaxID=703511 RepID=A0A6G1I251_9PEZI|nr:DNA-lyase [Trichodelitschia bisporula]
MPLATRTAGSKIIVGAHVSAAGGVHNSVLNSVHIGGNAFALFLKSRAKWANPPMDPDHCAQFLSNCKEHHYSAHEHVVPHASYLINLANPAKDRATQAYDAFLDDLDRCHRLGIRLYNFHPGNCVASASMDEGISHIAAQLNKAHADPSSGSVVTLLETMATGGNTIGGTFEHLASVIDQVKDKTRVGVCLDTCHVFAAGYDLRTPDAFTDTVTKFDQVIGLKYLHALHVNDSKAPFGSGRDLHARIGTGFLGLRAFWNLVNEPRLWGLPMVLETPIEVKDAGGKSTEDKGIWAREIKMLESLVGMDIESKEFKTLDAELQAEGKSERERIQDQVDRKKAKDDKAKEAKTKKGRGKSKKKEESESGD